MTDAKREAANKWLLPDGIEDVLPGVAAQREAVRRRLLDEFQCWGFEYVIPPMLEFLDSLLTGTGGDLDLKTFKVTDQLSGRTLGVRADMTPQVARIDAHGLNREGVVRLCYAGTVLHSRPDNMLSSRAPQMAGAEMFGDTGPEGDLEIVSLMVDSLQALGMGDMMLELGDVSIFRELVEGLPEKDQSRIFELIQRKAHADLEAATRDADIPTATADLLVELPNLYGDITVIDRARALFADKKDILARLDNLQAIVETVQSRFEHLDIYLDLSELRGYDYHTGIVFAAYCGGTRIAKGGRYDDVGRVFGRARRATGFDVHIASLADALPSLVSADIRRISVDAGVAAEPGGWDEIRRLRRQGNIVIVGDDGSDNTDFDAALTLSDGAFELKDC